MEYPQLCHHLLRQTNITIFALAYIPAFFHSRQWWIIAYVRIFFLVHNVYVYIYMHKYIYCLWISVLRCGSHNIDQTKVYPWALHYWFNLSVVRCSTMLSFWSSSIIVLTHYTGVLELVDRLVAWDHVKTIAIINTNEAVLG
jgi:hypothetical protein